RSIDGGQIAIGKRVVRGEQFTARALAVQDDARDELLELRQQPISNPVGEVGEKCWVLHQIVQVFDVQPLNVEIAQHGADALGICKESLGLGENLLRRREGTIIGSL